MKRDELLVLFLRERQSFAQVFPFANGMPTATAM